MYGGVAPVFAPRITGVLIFGFYVAVAVGLLKLYQWARIVTIFFASVSGALCFTLLFFGFRHEFRLIPFLTTVLQSVVYGYVALYLLTSNVREVFVRPVRDVSALFENT